MTSVRDGEPLGRSTSDVLRADDLDLVHDVRGLLLQRRKLHHVSQDNVLESAEDAVSMPRDPDIAVFPRFGGPADSTDPAIQGQLVGPLEDRDSQADLCDAQDRQRELLLDQQALFIFPNTRFRPELEVDGLVACQAARSRGLRSGLRLDGKRLVEGRKCRVG